MPPVQHQVQENNSGTQTPWGQVSQMWSCLRDLRVQEGIGQSRSAAQRLATEVWEDHNQTLTKQSFEQEH